MVACNTSNRIRYYYENILRYDLLLKSNYNNIMQVPRICKIIILAHNVPYDQVKSVSLALEIICGQKPRFQGLPYPSGQNFKSPGNRVSRGASKKIWSAYGSSSRSWQLTGKKGSITAPRGRTANRRISVSQSNLALLYCSLRARTMYNFLEKLISFNRLSETDLAEAEGIGSQSKVGPDAVIPVAGFRANDSKIQIKGQEVQVSLSNREVRLFPEIQNHFEFLAETSIQGVQIKIVTSASNERETRLLWTGLQQKEI